MEIRCKKCGKALHNPVSIARGMGPTCAGVATAGKSFHPHRHADSGATYPSIGASHSALNLFSFVAKQQDGVPPALKKFPSDLVELVLSAPAPGSRQRPIRGNARTRSSRVYSD